MRRKKNSLCIISIYKHSLSPDKLAGEFIITPKNICTKENQAKKKVAAFVNTFKCIYGTHKL